MESGTYYVFERSETGCYSNAAAINVVIDTTCPPDSQDYIDIAVQKVGSALNVIAGDTLNYTVTMTNVGTVTASKCTRARYYA